MRRDLDVLQQRLEEQRIREVSRTRDTGQPRQRRAPAPRAEQD